MSSSATTMNALLFDSASKTLEFTQLPKPTVKAPNDIVVKIAFAGLCGTDVHILKGHQDTAPSVVLGHEFSGTIVEAGPEAPSHLQVGTLVSVNPNDPCNQCSSCLRATPHFCATGCTASALGVFRNGGMAEYCVMPAHMAIALPASVPLDAGVFCEPLSCVLRGWDRIQPLDYDADILIVGAGIIGLLWAKVLYHCGYRKLTVSEVSAGRREVASTLPFIKNVRHPSELAAAYEEVKDTASRGLFDCVVDCSGVAIAIEGAFTWLKRGGKMCMFGVSNPESSASLKPHEFFSKELTVVGALVNPYTFPKAVGFVEGLLTGAPKALEFESLGVETFALSDYKAALEKVQNGSIAKAVFDMSL